MVFGWGEGSGGHTEYFKLKINTYSICGTEEAGRGSIEELLKAQLVWTGAFVCGVLR